jgi:regulatory protein
MGDGDRDGRGEGQDDGATRGSRGRPPRERRERVALGTLVEVPTGRVTALSERRAGSVRYVVEIDRGPSVVVSAEAIGELGLRVGGAIDEALGRRIATVAAELAVFDKAVALLAVRARSVRDLQLRLRRAGAEASLIAKAIDRLIALRLLDDEAYARNLARSRAMSGGVSRRRIGQELQRRGVARAVADDAVEETLADVGLDEETAALAIARRRVRALRTLDVRKQRQRLYAFLARRGYEVAIIARVVAAVVGSGVASDDDETVGGDADQAADEAAEEAVGDDGEIRDAD